jgi:hypothetical protein
VKLSLPVAAGPEATAVPPAAPDAGAPVTEAPVAPVAPRTWTVPALAPCSVLELNPRLAEEPWRAWADARGTGWLAITLVRRADVAAALAAGTLRAVPAA